MTVCRVPNAAVAGALLAGGLCADARGACLTADRDDQTVEGRLAHIQFMNYAGRKENAYILELSATACLEGTSDIDKVESSKRIHVFSMDAKLRANMRGLVGRRVQVKGYAFGEHTSYHHAPIVMNILAIERRR